MERRKKQSSRCRHTEGCGASRQPRASEAGRQGTVPDGPPAGRTSRRLHYPPCSPPPHPPPTLPERVRNTPALKRQRQRGIKQYPTRAAPFPAPTPAPPRGARCVAHGGRPVYPAGRTVTRGKAERPPSLPRPVDPGTAPPRAADAPHRPSSSSTAHHPTRPPYGHHRQPIVALKAAHPRLHAVCIGRPPQGGGGRGGGGGQPTPGGRRGRRWDGGGSGCGLDGVPGTPSAASGCGLSPMGDVTRGWAAARPPP